MTTHRYFEDAFTSVAEVLNGGFEQLFGNYGDDFGTMVRRTVTFFRDNGRADVASTFQASLGLVNLTAGRTGKVDREDFDADALDALDTVFYGQSDSVKHLFPEEAA